MIIVFLAFLILVVEIGIVEFVVRRSIGSMEHFLAHVVVVMPFIQNVRPEKTCGMEKNSKMSQKKKTQKIHSSFAFIKRVLIFLGKNDICFTSTNLPYVLIIQWKMTILCSSDDLVFECSACEATSNGFRYVCYEKGSSCDVSFDVRCCSISEPFHHELHPHVLYYVSTYNKRCAGCGALRSPALSCTVCEYALGVECATLPRKVKHRYDDHFLSLCQGAGNASGDLWCDICETKTDPSVWYYTCDECGVTLHIDCVLGDLYYLKRGHIFSDLEIIPNNGVSRPICSKCNRHCRFPSLFKRTTENSIVFACSLARCL
ncbi:unnamed protein product [Cochlearia groenlandica]